MSLCIWLAGQAERGFCAAARDEHSKRLWKNVSNSISTQMIFAGNVCRWPFNLISIHSELLGVQLVNAAENEVLCAWVSKPVWWWVYLIGKNGASNWTIYLCKPRAHKPKANKLRTWGGHEQTGRISVVIKPVEEIRFSELCQGS